jgi:hypothetical protein
MGISGDGKPRDSSTSAATAISWGWGSRQSRQSRTASGGGSGCEGRSSRHFNVKTGRYTHTQIINPPHGDSQFKMKIVCVLCVCLLLLLLCQIGGPNLRDTRLDLRSVG